MANSRTGNTCYVDTQSASSSDDLLVANIRVLRVFVTATAANGRIVLQDATTSTTLCDLRVATSGTTQEFRFFPNGIVFPNGIKASTLTNAVATIQLAESRG